MADDKNARIEQGYNPKASVEIVLDVMEKGYNPNGVIQTVAQLTQEGSGTGQSSTPPASGGSDNTPSKS